MKNCSTSINDSATKPGVTVALVRWNLADLTVMMQMNDEDYMRAAMEQARQAGAYGIFRSGTIVVLNGEIVGRGFQPADRAP